MSLFNDEVVIDPSKEYLPELVGEGKKYADQEALAKAKLHADLHIKKLEGELAQLRTEITSRPTEDRIQAIMDKIESLNKTPATPVVQPQAEPPRVVNMEEEVEKVLTKRQQAAVEAENLRKVQVALTEKFGPNYTQHLTQAANQLGVGKEFLEDAARKSPTAFLKLVGADVSLTPATSGMPPQSQSVFKPEGNQRTRSFYEKLKASDPAKYKAADLQMMQDALKLGEAFFD
jgi:hypothetical protein